MFLCEYLQLVEQHHCQSSQHFLLMLSYLPVTFSVKGKAFFKKLRMKKVKDAIFMDFWKSIRWLEIFILHLEKAFNNQEFMSMICWHFKRTVSM